MTDRPHAPTIAQLTAAAALVEAAGPRTHLVWSYRHDAWWAPNRRGYTVDTLGAGLYTEAEARAIVERSRRDAGGAGAAAHALVDLLAGVVWAREPGCLLDVVAALVAAGDAARGPALGAAFAPDVAPGGAEGARG